MTDTVDTSRDSAAFLAAVMNDRAPQNSTHDQRRAARVIMALLAERDQLRREVEEARDRALDEAATHILKTQIGFGKEDWMRGNNSGVKGSASAIIALKARP